MILSVVMIIAVLMASSTLFAWNDLFHLVVGGPIVAAGLILFGRWYKQWSGENTDPILDADNTPALRVGLGFVGGVALVLLLIGGFWLTSVVGLTDWFYDRDCVGLFTRLNDLSEDNAYPRLTQLIDDRLQHPTSSSCRQELLTRKVQALLAIAKTQSAEEGIRTLVDCSRSF